MVNQIKSIIMEYADNGDLFQKITEHQKKGTYIPENEIWNIFIQVTKGLKALHQLKILHRDMKSANVFLCKDLSVKLGDMNVSKVNKKGLLFTQTGTPYYASPEVWKDQPYDHKSDIWSLGCVLYEMCTLKPPFRAEDMEGLYKKVIRGHISKIPSIYSGDLGGVIKFLLQVSPHMRPTCDKILLLPGVIKRIEEQHLVETDEGPINLMNTIKIPFKYLHYLSDKLPKPNYDPLKTMKMEKSKFLQTLAGYNNQLKIIQENNPQYHSLDFLPKINKKQVKHKEKEVHLEKKESPKQSQQNLEDFNLKRENSKNNNILYEKREIHKERENIISPKHVIQVQKKKPTSIIQEIDSIIRNELQHEKKLRMNYLKKKQRKILPGNDILLPPIHVPHKKETILPQIQKVNRIDRANDILKIYGANIILKDEKYKNHIKLNKINSGLKKNKENGYQQQFKESLIHYKQLPSLFHQQNENA